MRIKHHQALAFSLVEMALALGIGGLCLSSIMGLMPVGILSNQASVEQTTAASIIKTVVADLRTTANSAQMQSPKYHFTPDKLSVTVPQTIFLDASGAPVDDSSKSRYRVSVGFTPPATGQKTATMVRVLVSWPSVADRDSSEWPKNYAGSCEAFTSLMR